MSTTIKIRAFSVLFCLANSLHLLSCSYSFATLSLEQKIGQLFVVTAIVDNAQNQLLLAAKGYRTDAAYIKQLIADYHIGGVIFLGSNSCQEQAELTQELQQCSALPLLIMQDLEWGLAMRLHDALRFPRNQALGALAPEHDELIYQMGYEVGKQCKLLGVHMNLAPVVDVNNNPANPVINDRSFGEDIACVARKAEQFMRGLQDAGIIACAKHFPGHGDTTVDSHYDLPCIKHTRERLDSCELYPFKRMISNGVKAIMSAHMEVPALEPAAHLPSSLSHNVVTTLLRQELGFKGLIITDALDMRGVTKHHHAGELELKALQAGNDILLCSTDVPKAIATIKQAIADGRLSEQELDEHVRVVLSLKAWAGCEKLPNFDQSLLCTPAAQSLKKELYAHAITVARDESHLLEALAQTKRPITCIEIGQDQSSHFVRSLENQMPMMVHTLPASADNQFVQDMIDHLYGDTVLVSVLGMSRFAAMQFGVTQRTLDCLRILKESGKKVVVVAFGNAYSLLLFKDADAVVIAYEGDVDAQQAAADVVSGTTQATGIVPITSKAL
ncbi:hypothetical protein JST99_03940 [Candidatus Dependentiae bacterium]|nr:hypothetical protein [Candidatus Dependentiae bacterium]MCC7414588.1 hypothetical protein [Campylobacterota bacterium]